MQSCLRFAHGVPEATPSGPSTPATASGILSGVLAFALRGEMIQAVHVIAGPAKLSFLGFPLASAV